MGQRIKQTLLKEDIQMAKKYMKRCLTSLIFREGNQNDNEVPLHASQDGCYPSLQAINAGEGVEKREPSYTVGGNAS